MRCRIPVSWVLGFALWAAGPGAALADCTAGDGNITSPGLCTTPQLLTGPSGTIVSGATLSTGPGAIPYNIISSSATVTNAGTVTSAGTAAFLVGNTISGIASLLNRGSIAAPQATQAGAGAITVNPGETLNLVNTGRISAGNGVAVAGLLGGTTITQADGTIGGVIDGATPPFNGSFALTVTGGRITGPITGSHFFSVHEGLVFSGSVNFDLGSSSFTTEGAVSADAVQVNSGTVTLNNPFSTSVVTNNATLVLAADGKTEVLTNNATVVVQGARTLSGSLNQSGSGTLVMQITPATSSQLTIRSSPSGSGDVALAGTLALRYQPGIYAPRSYTLISDKAFAFNHPRITGGFSTITGSVPTAGLAQSVVIDPVSVNLVLSPVAPANATVFAAGTSATLFNAQRATSILLDRPGPGAIDPLLAAAAPQSPRLQIAATANRLADALGAALPETMPQYGGWFHALGSFLSLDSDAAAPGFRATTGGFLGGIDRALDDDAWLGGAAGYAHTDIAERSPSTNAIDTARVALYGGSALGPAVLTGTTGYAYSRIATARPLTSSGTARAMHDGHEFTTAAQLAAPFESDGVRVTPKTGVQFVHLGETGFSESGAAGFNLNGRGHDTDSLQPYIAIDAARAFVTEDGTIIMPSTQVGYHREALSNRRSSTIITPFGVGFTIDGIKPAKDMLSVGIGVTIRRSDWLVFYAGYDVTLPTGNTTDHTASAGLRLRF